MGRGVLLAELGYHEAGIAVPLAETGDLTVRPLEITECPVRPEILVRSIHRS